MVLSKTHLKDICLLNKKSRQCRYLDGDENDKGEHVYVCRKLTSEGKAIDDELDDYLVELKKNKTDPDSKDVPLANNCTGYPALPNVKQGYDV
jgi:hypothetical protein